ncbi:hypothetical protein EJ08DRAFT_109770 [Tothia fuscella]|uniref:Uncharacterized protein n=1 Tax=Tothia fuscella TaxID=1048955 RepID=A0A9P4NW41_9PEZI|nr:hypothetical protein EJ08DRAFT_109770 [Tothia fuscella]
MRAQAVMRRDLMLSRANKAFEEAEEAEANAQPIIVEKVEEAQSVANGTAKDAVDLTMSDEPIVIEDTPPKLQQKAKEVVVKTEPTTVETAPTTMAEDTTAKTPTTTGDTKADDFDAIFGDFAETSPTNNNDTSIDMNDFPDSSADVSSLLPGLENYASMPDPSTSTPDLSANMPDLSASMPENRVPEALTTTNNMSSLDSGGLDFNMLGIPGQEENQDQKVKVGQSDKQAGDGEVTNYDNDNSFDDLFDMSYMDNNVENNQDMEDWMASLN